MGDVNCACLIDAEPDPVWKFRILPWDESYQDSIVAEIDAVTGEMTDLDMYKSDHQDLEPSFHMITLHRIWARLELEENGPLYLARLVVLKRFADMSFDMPEVDDLPIFDLRYWNPEIQGRVIRFRSQWKDLPDYEVELDENGVAVRTEEKETSGTEALPMELDREAIDESLYLIDNVIECDPQQEVTKHIAQKFGFTRAGSRDGLDVYERKISIKKMETDDEIKGKAYVHWKSWHEAYPGIVSQNYL